MIIAVEYKVKVRGGLTQKLRGILFSDKKSSGLRVAKKEAEIVRADMLKYYDETEPELEAQVEVANIATYNDFVISITDGVIKKYQEK